MDYIFRNSWKLQEEKRNILFPLFLFLTQWKFTLKFGIRSGIHHKPDIPATLLDVPILNFWVGIFSLYRERNNDQHFAVYHVASVCTLKRKMVNYGRHRRELFQLGNRLPANEKSNHLVAGSNQWFFSGFRTVKLIKGLRVVLSSNYVQTLILFSNKCLRKEATWWDCRSVILAEEALRNSFVNPNYLFY